MKRTYQDIRWFLVPLILSFITHLLIGVKSPHMINGLIVWFHKVLDAQISIYVIKFSYYSTILLFTTVRLRIE